MNNKIKNTLKIIVFIGIGLFIFWLVYKDFDFKGFFSTIDKINFWWLLPTAILSILSHICRARRWQLLIETIGNKPHFTNTFLAVLNAYFANLALPRLGEVTRCAIIAKYEKHDFSKILGTIVCERLLDLIAVAILTIIAFSTQAEIFYNFVNNHPEIKQNLTKYINPITITIVSLLCIASILFVIAIYKGKFNRLSICKKISNFIKKFWEGFSCLKDLKQKTKVIFHSIAIWILYFIMLYFCFLAFSELENLSILTALLLFVASSLGMLVPSPNGIGSYHFMIIQTLILYGIAEEIGAAFALVAHSLQTALIIALGLIATIIIPIYNKNK